MKARELGIIVLMVIVAILWGIAFCLIVAVDWLKELAYSEERKIISKQKKAKSRFKGVH